jgi:hypothetical protein
MFKKNKQKTSSIDIANCSAEEGDFRRVLNTLKKNKVTVQKRADGIYLRMAGNIHEGECFSKDFVRVKKFDNDIDVKCSKQVNNNLKKTSIVASIKCYFGFHKWIYDKKTVVKCNRTCKNCGKKMSSCYDMSYGETVWINGHHW